MYDIKTWTAAFKDSQGKSVMELKTAVMYLFLPYDYLVQKGVFHTTKLVQSLKSVTSYRCISHNTILCHIHVKV